jgi:hypothetical protein
MTNSSHCGECFHQCPGRFPSCVEGECQGWSACFSGMGMRPGSGSIDPCNPICENIGAIPSTNCNYGSDRYSQIAFYMDTDPTGLERCEDLSHHPGGDNISSGVFYLAWTCCCKF